MYTTVILILVLILILAFVLLISTRRIKGGAIDGFPSLKGSYYHKIVFDDESVRIMNNFMKAFIDALMDDEFKDFITETLSDEISAERRVKIFNIMKELDAKADPEKLKKLRDIENTFIRNEYKSNRFVKRGMEREDCVYQISIDGLGDFSLTYDGLMKIYKSNKQLFKDIYGVSCRDLDSYLDTYKEIRTYFDNAVLAMKTNKPLDRKYDDMLFKALNTYSRVSPDKIDDIYDDIRYIYDEYKFDAEKNIKNVYDIPFGFEDQTKVYAMRNQHPQSFEYGGIKNGNRDKPTVNNMRLHPLTNERFNFLNTVARINKTSFSVSYENEDYDQYKHFINLYKGVKDDEISGKSLNENIYPFKQMIVGYEYIEMDSRASMSGFGLYTTPSFEVAAKYAEHVIYTYDCHYNRYVYTFVDVEIDKSIFDTVMRYLTYDYNERYISFPSDRALKFWSILHPEYKELQIFGDYETIKNELISECKYLRDVLTMKPLQQSSSYKFDYYLDRDVDIIISYTRGNKKESNIDVLLRNKTPCFEVLPIHGRGVRLREVLLIDFHQIKQ